MDQEITIILRLLTATVFGLLIGYERESRQRVKGEEEKGGAGLRTHAMVCLGSCLITAVGIFAFPYDTARMAASIMTGIGFLGAGTIMATAGRIKGLTTAASIWVAATIGICVGVGNYLVALVATILSLIILELYRIEGISNIHNGNAEKKKK